MALPAPLRALARAVTPPAIRRRRFVRFLEREVSDNGEAELAWLDALVRPGDLCVDAGANNGTYSFQLARLGARVVAFEPNSDMAAFIRRIGDARIEVRTVGLSSRDGHAELVVPHGEASLATLRAVEKTGGDRAFTVETRRLDGLGLGPVAFIKIDVEGFEEQVLIGAMATLERDRPLLLVEVEERHNAGGLGRIGAMLETLGYAGWSLQAGTWTPLAAFDPARHQRQQDVDAIGATVPRRSVAYYNNFLFLPDGRQPPEARPCRH